MLRHTGKGVAAICDNDCGRKVVHHTRNVQDLTNEARRRGWLVEPGERGDWRHICADCGKLEGKDQFK